MRHRRAEFGVIVRQASLVCSRYISSLLRCTSFLVEHARACLPFYINGRATTNRSWLASA
jgi:hypothetical protein